MVGAIGNKCAGIGIAGCLPQARNTTAEQSALVVKDILGLSESPNRGALWKIPHVQTSIDRGAPDPGHFTDRCGGLRHPRNLLDHSTTLTDSACARGAAEASILQPPPL